MRSSAILEFYRQASQQVLTVVDVETTGRYPRTDRITEISVLQATLKDDILTQQTTLLNPEISIPANIVQFTGITQKMVDAAPLAADALPAFLPLLSQGILTAHNIEFDYPFLQAEFDRFGTPYSRSPADQLCTVQLSRLMLPELPSRRLPHLVKYFGFDVGRSHRAAADTIACWLLAKRLLTDLLSLPDAELLAKFARQTLPLKYAAELLDCSPEEAQIQLNLAGAHARFVGRGRYGTLMYKRGDVERLLSDRPS